MVRCSCARLITCTEKLPGCAPPATVATTPLSVELAVSERKPAGSESDAAAVRTAVTFERNDDICVLACVTLAC